MLFVGCDYKEIRCNYYFFVLRVLKIFGFDFNIGLLEISFN